MDLPPRGEAHGATGSPRPSSVSSRHPPGSPPGTQASHINAFNLSASPSVQRLAFSGEVELRKLLEQVARRFAPLQHLPDMPHGKTRTPKHRSRQP